MVDFNTQFEQHTAIQEQSDMQARILEAMFELEKTEADYRARGVSEAEISQLHEGVMDKLKAAKDSISSKAKTAWNSEKAQAIKERLKKIVEKFVNFFKKLWTKIKSKIFSDEKFLKPYKSDLMKHASELSDVEAPMKAFLFGEAKKTVEAAFLHDWSDSKSKDEYEAEEKKFNNQAFRTSKNYSVKELGGIGEVISDFESGQKTINDYDKAIKVVENAIKALKVTDETSEKFMAYLKAHRAALRLCADFIVEVHRANKALLVKCIGKLKHMDEAAIEFYTEASNREIDTLFTEYFVALDQPIVFTEADDSGKSEGKLGKIKSIVRGIISKVEDAISRVFEAFVRIGRKIVTFISEKVKEIWDRTKKYAAKAKTTIKLNKPVEIELYDIEKFMKDTVEPTSSMTDDYLKELKESYHKDSVPSTKITVRTGAEAVKICEDTIKQANTVLDGLKKSLEQANKVESSVKQVKTADAKKFLKILGMVIAGIAAIGTGVFAAAAASAYISGAAGGGIITALFGKGASISVGTWLAGIIGTTGADAVAAASTAMTAHAGITAAAAGATAVGGAALVASEEYKVYQAQKQNKAFTAAMAHIGLFLSTYQTFYSHCSQAIGHCIKSCNQIIAKVVGTSVNQSESAIVSEIQMYNESVDYGINNIMYEADMYDLNNDSLSINLEALNLGRNANNQQQNNTQQAAKPSGNMASKAQSMMSKASEFIKSKFGKFVDWIKKIIKWCRDKISEAWTKFQGFAEKVKADLNDIEVQISVIDNLKELAGGSLPNNLDSNASIEDLEKIAQEYEGKEFKTSTQTVHGSAGLNLVRDMITRANSTIKYLEEISNKVEAFNKETQATLAAKDKNIADLSQKKALGVFKTTDTARAEEDKANYEKGEGAQRNAFYRAAKAVVQYELKVVQTILKTSREAEAKILGKAANKSEATIVAVIESYNNALDYDVSGFIYEAETSDIDDVIERATSGDAQGVTDVNHASTEVIPSAASTDPNALNYDKTNVYSQDTPIGDENTAGTIEREIKTDTTTVTPGNETKALEAFEGWLDKFADLQLA